MLHHDGAPVILYLYPVFPRVITGEELILNCCISLPFAGAGCPSIGDALIEYPPLAGFGLGLGVPPLGLGAGGLGGGGGAGGGGGGGIAIFLYLVTFTVY
jgi:hypothetical protein